MKIIGLYGYGGVGKDAVGDILVNEHGYTRFAKGDLIKEVAWRIDPTIGTTNKSLQTLSWDRGGYHYQTTTEKIDHLKAVYPEVRLFLQHLADDIVTVLGHDVWNEALYEKIKASGADKIVLTRLSLPFEADRLWLEGGKLVRVVRQDYGPANLHPNEIALDDHEPDAIIHNNGTLADLTVSAELLEALWS